MTRKKETKEIKDAAQLAYEINEEFKEKYEVKDREYRSGVVDDDYDPQTGINLSVGIEMYFADKETAVQYLYFLRDLPANIRCLPSINFDYESPDGTLLAIRMTDELIEVDEDESEDGIEHLSEASFECEDDNGDVAATEEKDGGGYPYNVSWWLRTTEKD